MDAHLARLFAHVAWADGRILRRLNESAGARRPAVMRLFAHLLAAERVWLLRLRGRDAASQAIWPDLSLVEMNAMAAANATGYGRLLAELGPAGAAAEARYADSRGVAHRTAVSDVLLHVALHGSYHRGQVAAALRAVGEEPVSTDFIAFVREEAGAAPAGPARTAVLLP